MKTVGHFANLEEAQLLKMKLGACGIEAVIPNENTAGLASFLFMNKPGIRVQVADEDEEEAQRIATSETEPMGDDEE